MQEEIVGELDTYVVVVNSDGQHSIWLKESEPPNGWRQVGMEGSRAACLAYIREYWTDLRPHHVSQ